MVSIKNIVLTSTYDFNLILSFLFHFQYKKNMHTFIINLFILLVTILTFVELRPVSKLEQSLIRQRRQNQRNLFRYQDSPMIDDIRNHINSVLHFHLHGLSEPGCIHTTKDNYGDYIEYCFEKIPNQDGKPYSIKISKTLYKTDGTSIPFH